MSGEFTTEELAEFREAFGMFDRDGKGSIPRNVLPTVVRSLGLSPEADLATDGDINFEEFLDFMRTQDRGLEVDEVCELREALSVFHCDGTGCISTEHLPEILSLYMDDAQVDSIRSSCGDDSVELEEVLKMIFKDDYVPLGDRTALTKSAVRWPAGEETAC